MEFEDWWYKAGAPSWWCPELESEDSARDAWNYQQKKIDELQETIDKLLADSDDGKEDVGI